MFSTAAAQRRTPLNADPLGGRAGRRREVHYAIDAANRMIAALDDASVLGPLRVHNALHVGCENLKRISNDLLPGRSLARDMAFVEEQRRASQADFYRAIETVESFAEAFNHIERTALREAGAHDRLLRLIPSDRSRLLRALRDEDLSAERLRSRIDRLTESVCEFRDTLASLYLSPRGRRSARGLLRRATLGVFGAGTVSANAATDIVTTLGLAPWATALSGAVGSAMVGNAILGD